MGDVADMVLDGTLCRVCGGAMEDVGPDFVPPGHPRTCEDCKPSKRRTRRGKRGGKKHRVMTGGDGQ